MATGTVYASDSLTGPGVEPNVDFFKTVTGAQFASNCPTAAASLTQVASGIQFFNAAFITSLQDFNMWRLGNGIVVSGQVSWQSSNDRFYVRTRSKGVNYFNANGLDITGLGIRMQLSSTTVSLRWVGPDGQFINADGTRSYSGQGLNLFQDFLLIDDGIHMLAAMRPVGNAAWSVVSYARSRYRPCYWKVSFQNRACSYQSTLANISIKQLTSTVRSLDYSPPPDHCTISITPTQSVTRTPTVTPTVSISATPQSGTITPTVTATATVTPQSLSVTITPMSVTSTRSITPTESLSPSVTPSNYLYPDMPRGPMLLSDPLMNTLPNPMLWNTITGYFVPNCIGTLAELLPTPNGLDITNRAYMSTAADFDPAQLGGIIVSGRWTFYTPYDFLQVLTRSTGVPTGQYSEDTSALTFLCMPDNYGYTSCEFGLPPDDNGGYSDSASFNIVFGDSYDFVVIDTGTYMLGAMRRTPFFSESTSPSTSSSESNTPTASPTPTISITSSPVSLTNTASVSLTVSNSASSTSSVSITRSTTASTSFTSTATRTISVSNTPVSVTPSPSSSSTPYSNTNTASPSSTPFPWEVIVRGHSTARHCYNKVTLHNRECEYHSRVANIQVFQVAPGARPLDLVPSPVPCSPSTTPYSRSVTATPSRTPGLMNSIAGWWQFNNPGNPGFDSSANANNLVAHDVTASSSGYGNFTADGWLGMPGDIPDLQNYYYDPFYSIPTNLPVGFTSYTIAARFKYAPENTNNDAPIVSWGWSSRGAVQLGTDGNTYVFNKWGSSDYLGLTTPNMFDNQWHCLAMVVNAEGSETIMYIDGSRAGSQEGYGQPDILPANFRIGSGIDFYSHFGPGLMDNLAVWGRVLSPEELAIYYSMDASVECASSLVALYRFNTPDVGFDSSPRQNNLTAYGGATLFNNTLKLDGTGYLWPRRAAELTDSNVVPRGLPFDVSSYTIALRFLLDPNAGNQGNAGFIGWGYPQYQEVNNLRLDGNAAVVNEWNHDSTYSSAPHGDLADGKWHTLAATWDSDSGVHVVYLDHKKVYNDTLSNKPYVYPTDFRIGCVNSNAYLTGQLDDVAIWNRALTQFEVYHFFIPLSNTPTPSITPTISVTASVSPVPVPTNGGTEGINANGDGSGSGPLAGYKIAIIVVILVLVAAATVIAVVVIMKRRKKSNYATGKQDTMTTVDLEMQEPTALDSVTPGGALAGSKPNIQATAK